VIELTQGGIVAGKYRLDRVIGRGGMGVVWAATHTVTRKLVALKLVRGEPADPDARRRFLREARAACAVKHPSVVEVHDVVELEDGSPMMVMEHLRGESFADRLQREPKLPLHEVARIMVPVISAVGTAHALGIVHRDLKPQNIFLVDGFEGAPGVKVLDFGIAKLTSLEGDAAQTAGITNTGALLGTPCYMSPEQAFGEKDIDHRADVWALGIILYECFSGVLPTSASNIGQVLKIVLTGSIPPLASVVPELPPEVTSLVDRMLSQDRARRPSDLREAKRILEACAGAPADASAQDFGPPSAVAPPTTDPRLASGGASGALATLPSDPPNARAHTPTPASGRGVVVAGSATVDPLGATGALTPSVAPSTPPRSARRGALLAGAVVTAGLAAALAAWSTLRGGATPQATPVLAGAPSAADPSPTSPALPTLPTLDGAPASSAPGSGGITMTTATSGTAPASSAPAPQPSSSAPRVRPAVKVAPALAPSAPPVKADPPRPHGPIVEKPPF
jgi:serine/threonine protein kinase